MPSDDNRNEHLYELPIATEEDRAWTVEQMLTEYIELVHRLPPDVNLFQVGFDSFLGSRVNRNAETMEANIANTSWAVEQVLDFLENPEKPVRYSTPNQVSWYLLQVMRNEQMLADEISEFRNWLPWKFWKKTNRQNYKLPHRRELQMEVVGMFHFVLDFARLAGMDGATLAQLMRAKMQINRERWEGGY